MEHPEIPDKSPPNAAVVLLPDDDPEFFNKIIKLIDHYRALDEVENRPIVYVRVESQAPAPPPKLVGPHVEKGAE